MRAKCPVCGKCHLYQHTAGSCLSEVLISTDMRIIAGDQLTVEEVERKRAILNYYHKLPIHKKFTRWKEENEK